MRHVTFLRRNRQPSGTVIRLASMLRLGTAQCQYCGFVVKLGPGASALMEAHEVQQHGRLA